MKFSYIDMHLMQGYIGQFVIILLQNTNTYVNDHDFNERKGNNWSINLYKKNQNINMYIL